MPTTKSKPKSKKYQKPLTSVIDSQIKNGGSWDKILANINRIASRRGMWTPYTKGDINWHIKKRLEKDPNYFGGTVDATDEGVTVKSK